MGLERRGNGRYFYRKVRCGDRVSSEYVGTGLVAAVLAEQHETAQRERRAERRAIEQVEVADRALVRPDRAANGNATGPGVDSAADLFAPLWTSLNQLSPSSGQ